MSKRRVGLAVGLVAALGLGGGLMAFGSGHFASKKSKTFHLDKARVERGNVTARVTATGTVSPRVTVQVGSQVSGRISELYADFGSRVKKGQVIAKLDPRMFGAAAEQSDANRAAAAADVDKARAEAEAAEQQLERATKLSAQNLISKAEFDTATTNAKAARAAVAAAQGNRSQATAALHQARVNLGYTTIKSPIDGIVVSRNVDVGQTVAASLQAPTLFTIAEDLAKMQVHAAVSEADVGRLAPDMPATFTVDAYPDQKFKGVIRQIRDAPQTTQNVVTYDAVIDVDNVDFRLKPGMTANVTFVYAERKDVLRVPTAALRFRPPDALLAERSAGGDPVGQGKEKGKGKNKGQGPGQGKKARDVAAAPGGSGEEKSVWKLTDGALSRVAIQIGVSDGNKVEITEGQLAEGDVIVTDAVDKSERAQAKAKNKGLF
jgi:HlyD family secretion protein